MTDQVAEPTGETNAGTSDVRASGQDPRVAELSRESAAYRTQRNDALRRAHAYETMLKAHGVDLSGVTSEALAGLPISGGKVDGAFAYTPPKVEVPRGTPPAERAGDGKPALTLDEVRRWPSAEINKRWSEVSALLAQER